jgi:hypothetical protein
MTIVASNPLRLNAKFSYTFKACRHLQKLSIILLGATIAWIAWTQAAAEPVNQPSSEPPALQALPEPPDIPPRVKSGETLEPEVTIRRDARQTVTEYRVGGRVKAIKIEPVVGPAYWLVDTTGDGFTEMRYDNLDPPFLIPGWVILRW